MRRFKPSHAALVLLMSTAGMAGAQAPAAGNTVVARLGEATVAQDEIERLLQSLPEAERTAIKADRTVLDNWLRQRLLSEAVLRDARAKGWADRADVKAKVEAATREIASRIVSTSYIESVSQVPAGYPSDAEVKAAYEQGKTGYNLPAAYRVAQIYLQRPTATRPPWPRCAKRPRSSRARPAPATSRPWPAPARRTSAAPSAAARSTPCLSRASCPSCATPSPGSSRGRSANPCRPKRASMW